MVAGQTRLSSTQLYRLAAQCHIRLTQSEKDRVSPDYLFVLALTGKLVLNQHDKYRLRPLHVGIWRSRREASSVKQTGTGCPPNCCSSCSWQAASS